MNRRDAMRTLAAPALGLGLGLTAARADQGTTLVAYLTRSGNTRVFAETLARELPGDLFQIRTAEPYPADYFAHVALAQQQRDMGATPALAEGVNDITRYDTVFLGFPVWGGALPAPVRSFLSAHDLSGKTLVPLITHGGFGEGSANDTVRSLAPGARHLPPFVIECDQERRQLGLLHDWLDTVTL